MLSLLKAFSLFLEYLVLHYRGSSRTFPYLLSLLMTPVTHLFRTPSPALSLKVLFSVLCSSFFTPPHSANSFAHPLLIITSKLTTHIVYKTVNFRQPLYLKPVLIPQT